jgi:hypothetical protein
MGDSTSNSEHAIGLQRAARLVVLAMEDRCDEAALLLELVPDDELRELTAYVLLTTTVTVETVVGRLPAIAQLQKMLAETRRLL